jgi:hypothetical protein
VREIDADIDERHATAFEGACVVQCAIRRAIVRVWIVVQSAS